MKPFSIIVPLALVAAVLAGCSPASGTGDRPLAVAKIFPVRCAVGDTLSVFLTSINEVTPSITGLGDATVILSHGGTDYPMRTLGIYLQQGYPNPTIFGTFARNSAINTLLNEGYGEVAIQCKIDSTAPPESNVVVLLKNRTPQRIESSITESVTK